MIYLRILALAAIIGGLFTAGYKAGVNSIKADLLEQQQEFERIRLQDGQEAADLIQEVLDEQRKEKIIYKTKYVDRIRNVTVDSCKLDAERLQIWQSAINAANGIASEADKPNPTLR